MSEQLGAHLDLDTLADHLAGEVDAGGHLAACAGCAARLAELEAGEQMVVAALASLAAPALPADVADRLTAAFAAEAPGSGRPAATVTAISRRPRRAWLTAAAAGLVLFSGGAIGLSVLGGQSSVNDSSTGATALSAPEAGSFPTVNSGVDYSDAPAVAAGLPAVLAGTANPTVLRLADAAASSSTAQESVPAEESAPVTDDPLDRLRTAEGLADCLAALLPPQEPDVRPLAVDYASFNGEPALAVVLPDPDPTKVSVFVVSAGCTRAFDGTLFFTRLDRP